MEEPNITMTNQAGDTRPADSGITTRLIIATVTAFVVIVGLGGWGATANINGAVIAQGQIVVDGSSKKVQHPSGGIIAKIAVKNGDLVAAGDVLIQLDATQTRASLGVITAELTELIARRARHAAERNQAKDITFPVDFLSSSPDAVKIAAGERRLFNANMSITKSRKAQLAERIGQLDEEIAGVIKQSEAKAREHALVARELARLRYMYERKLTPVTRVLAMERDEVRIAGEHARLFSTVASAKGQRTEIKIQILAIDQDARSKAQGLLRDTEAQISRLNEQKTAAVDELRRVVIRAPRAGIVHNLAVHMIGGVVAPGDALLVIVPTAARLAIDTRIAPSDIDQLHIGHDAILQFSAFNQRTTPELAGRVTRIGADLTADPRSNDIFYSVRIEADDEALTQLDGLALVPGMPVEAYIQTGGRTALSYFFKPISDQLTRAFREE